MKFSKYNLKKYIQLLKMPKAITIIVLCINLILLLLIDFIFNPFIYPEFKTIKIFLVFNSFFLAEFMYLIFSQYIIKDAFLYSISSNYIICSLYYITNDQMIKSSINSIDFDFCCFFRGDLPCEFKIYIDNSKLLEYLFVYLVASMLIKLILFKIINIKNIEARILDFFIVNITFIIFYLSLSNNYLLLKESINTYYNYKLYSPKTYEFLIDKYCNDNFYENITPEQRRINERKKKFYSKPNNVFSKVLDFFVVEPNNE